MISIILERSIRLETNAMEDNFNKNHAKEMLISILEKALIQNASDVHIEPQEEIFLIRMRIDGQLKEVLSLDMDKYSPLATYIKLNGGMNIAEKRVPQDGRKDFLINNQNIDIRISSIPTIYGEKIVLRLLNRNEILKDKEELGFSRDDIEKISKMITNKSGILLITGATGSGKTTTVYSILKDLVDKCKNIMTIEDPVEYKIKGINQVQVNSKIGLDFNMGLRSILRQDPDIIMIGEIRDLETAQIAIRAATTGHLVISTMHTKDAISSVFRLREMGIPNYLISSSIIGVISQKLLRKICNDCSHEIIIQNEEHGEATCKVAIGCELCDDTGYIGRIAAYEILEINNEIAQAISNNENYQVIRGISKESGMTTFENTTQRLIDKNITTIEECNFIESIK